MKNKLDITRNKTNRYLKNFTSTLLIILTLSCIPQIGFSKSSGDTKVRMSFDQSGVTIKEVLTSIESKSEYVFFYSDEIKNDLNKRVNIHVNSKTVSEILSNLLKDTQLSFRFNENQVTIARNQKINADNYIRINGTIKDKDRNPMPGVNILVKGTNLGTASDIDGNFFLEVPDKNAVLQFQFIGFESQEIKVGNQININVILKENETALEEVVVVGYGSQKRVSVVGSITTIEPGKLKAGTTRSMSNNLAGQLAGVIGVQRSGEPGYDNSNFWIRGISSFAGNNNPLVLVDGVERSLNNLDPSEIESFSVLKDASASAVYGVRGANGVVIINTKRGEIGKPKVSVRLDQGITKLGKLPEFIGSADYLSLLNEIARDENKPERYTEEQILKYRTGEDPDLFPNVNWVDAITDDYGHNTRANLTVSGGSEILRYSLVGSFYNEKGIISRDKRQEWNSSSSLNRYNVRSNVDVDVTKTTVFRVNIGGYLQDRRRAPESVDNLFSVAFDTPPFVHPQQYSSGEIPVVPQRANPWALATQRGYETFSDSKLESLFSIEQNLNFITEGLKTKAIFSFDRFQGNGVSRSKSPDYYNPAVGRNEDGSLNLVIYSYGQNFLNHSNSSDWGNKRTYLEWTVSYDRTFGKHTVNGMFLINRSNYEDGSKLPYRNQGIAGRASYTYDSRYVAELNFGYNGSENFAKGSRYGFFPSVAVGWLLSEEPFMKPYKETFSKIKFRGSYGLVGNDQLGANRGDYRFAYLTTIGDTDGYRWGVDNDYHRSGRWEGNVGVANLTWETVKKANIGLELGLWNAIELQADYFKDRRENIFLQRQTMPGSAGFVQTPFQNFGIVTNQGIDLSLTANKQVSKDFLISARGTFTYAKNKIIEQDEPLGVLGTNRSSTGYPIGQIFGLQDDGLFTDADFVDGELIEGIPEHTFSKVRPGDIKYKDVNKDGVINDLDRSAIGGTWNPQIVYGFGLNFQYKNFDFGFFFQGNAKTYRLIGGSNFIPGSGDGSMGNILSNYQDHWTVDNPDQNAFWPRLSSSRNANNTQESTWWLHDMSMLRLKNVELGYNFSKKKLLPAFIQSARLFVTGSNLLQFSGFKLWDPELDTSTGLRYPIMKSASFGLEVNF